MMEYPRPLFPKIPTFPYSSIPSPPFDCGQRPRYVYGRCHACAPCAHIHCARDNAVSSVANGHTPARFRSRPAVGTYWIAAESRYQNKGLEYWSSGRTANWNSEPRSPPSGRRVVERTMPPRVTIAASRISMSSRFVIESRWRAEERFCAGLLLRRNGSVTRARNTIALFGTTDLPRHCNIPSFQYSITPSFLSGMSMSGLVSASS